MTRQEFGGRIEPRALGAGVTVDSDLLDRLFAYYEILARWNRTINLTAVDLDELPPVAVDRLLIEPLAAAHHVASRTRIIDIGSGGGSPAIPFALAVDAISLTMVESKARKSVFLQEAARVVGIPANVVTARFEHALGQPELRERFEALTVRAVRLDGDTLLKLAGFIVAGGALLVFQREPLKLDSEYLQAEAPHLLTPTAILQIFSKGG